MDETPKGRENCSPNTTSSWTILGGDLKERNPLNWALYLLSVPQYFQCCFRHTKYAGIVSMYLNRTSLGGKFTTFSNGSPSGENSNHFLADSMNLLVGPSYWAGQKVCPGFSYCITKIGSIWSTVESTWELNEHRTLPLHIGYLQRSAKLGCYPVATDTTFFQRKREADSQARIREGNHQLICSFLKMAFSVKGNSWVGVFTISSASCFLKMLSSTWAIRLMGIWD